MKRRYICRSSKVGYATHRLAMMAVRLIRDTSRRAAVPQRAYHCELCDRWHLTSRERGREVSV